MMAKVLSAEATDEELQLLQRVLKEDATLQQTFLYLQHLEVNVNKSLLLQEEIKRRENKGFLRMNKMLSFETPSASEGRRKSKGAFFMRNRPWLVAASALLIIGLAALVFISREQFPPKAANTVPVVETFVATQAISIELEDGTKVWLNKGSKLKCDKAFNSANREVYLIGEGFFDVAKDAEIPFVVHLKQGVDIKVLGTRFNVKSYPNTPFIEASLLSGKIALDLNENDQQELLLKPNEKITINLNELDSSPNTNKLDTIAAVHKILLKPNPVDRKLSETAWMDDRLSFYDMSFEELAYELERFYGKKFVFKNKRLKNWHLTGSFKDETLLQVLNALQITTPFSYRIIDNKVILYSNSKK